MLSYYCLLPSPYLDFSDCHRKVSLMVGSLKPKLKQASHIALGGSVS